MFSKKSIHILDVMCYHNILRGEGYVKGEWGFSPVVWVGDSTRVNERVMACL